MPCSSVANWFWSNFWPKCQSILNRHILVQKCQLTARYRLNAGYCNCFFLVIERVVSGVFCGCGSINFIGHVGPAPPISSNLLIAGVYRPLPGPNWRQSPTVLGASRGDNFSTSQSLAFTMASAYYWYLVIPINSRSLCSASLEKRSVPFLTEQVLRVGRLAQRLHWFTAGFGEKEVSLSV